MIDTEDSGKQYCWFNNTNSVCETNISTQLASDEKGTHHFLSCYKVEVMIIASASASPQLQAMTWHGK